MSFQRSANSLPKHALPKTTLFILPGRRTLSEHLPAEIIDVPLTLTQRSSYLRKAIAQQALKDPRQKQISLPNVDSMGFRMYIEWLRTGRVEFHALTHVSASKGLLLRDCFDLIFAHMAGSQLEEPDFQDYIIDTMAQLLDTSQTPDLKVLEVVFLENGASSILKQFVVDRMFAVERKMLGMMRGLVGDMEGAGENNKRCEYHVHEEGNCYRDRLKREHGSATRVTNASLRHGTNTGDDCRRLPHSSSTTLYTEETMHNMIGASYFGSVGWSRDVDSPRRRALASSLFVDKPLPTIPPLTPGSAPSPPSSPRSLHVAYSNPEFPTSEDMSTQQLIYECLSRLPPSELAPSSPPQPPPGPDQTAIPSLILECLERFKTSSLNKTTSDAAESSEESSPQPSSPISMPIAPEQSYPQLVSTYHTVILPEQYDQASLLRLEVPYPHQQVHLEMRFDELAKPQQAQSHQPRRHSQCKFTLAQVLSPQFLAFEAPSQHLRPEHDYRVLADSKILPLALAVPQIKRKVAPPRGADWLSQYDRVNDMQNTSPLVMAKRSKTSRFKELLRSESTWSRAELEG